MSKKFTRLYTGNAVVTGGGKCLKQLVPDVKETWLWNSTLTGFPEYTVNGNSQTVIKAVRKQSTVCVDFYSNGVKYNAIQYFSAKVYNWSGTADGYSMRGLIYYKDFDPETGAISTDGVVAYGIEDNYAHGWMSSAYRTVTYTSVPKDTNFIAFRKTNATKTATSVLSVMDDEPSVNNSELSAIISILAKK